MEEEIKAIRMQFQEILNKLVNNKIAPTGTAILVAEQPMILLFEELMNKIEKQQQELDKEKEKNKEYEDFYGTSPTFEDSKYIEKNKIREKIKELEIVKNTPVKDDNYTYKECIEYGIEELQKLLED